MSRTVCGATRPHAALFHLIVFFASIFLAIMLPASMSGAVNPPPLKLQRGWRVQSSAKVSGEGPAISSPGFHAEGWYDATVTSGLKSTEVALP
jgi:hypothetical protein